MTFWAAEHHFDVSKLNHTRPENRTLPVRVNGLQSLFTRM
jgi:hypothetical protein